MRGFIGAVLIATMAAVMAPNPAFAKTYWVRHCVNGLTDPGAWPTSAPPLTEMRLLITPH